MDVCFRWASLSFTVASCGPRLNCCVWQLDLSTELRKLTSTASLSSYRRSCSEHSPTSLTSTTHAVGLLISDLMFTIPNDTIQYDNLTCDKKVRMFSSTPTLSPDFLPVIHGGRLNTHTVAYILLCSRSAYHLSTFWCTFVCRIYHFYPRDAMLARVIAIATCLSVCPSVTRRYCVKTKKASGMISSPSDSPKTLVSWRQISSPNSKGFPPERGPQIRVGRKNSAIF